MRQVDEVGEKGEDDGARRGAPAPLQKEGQRAREGMERLEGDAENGMWRVGVGEGRW